MKLSEFESNAQQYWLRKLVEVLYMRRSTMFRFIAETSRVLVIGNGGGVALTLGMLGTAQLAGVYHILCMLMLLTFVIGVLFSAITLFLVTGVTVKEAHNAEISLHKFTKDQMERDEVLFFDDPRTRRLANIAAGCGIVSIGLLTLGALQGLVQVAIYF